jgi:uncharacterized membrane protein YfcA
MSTWTSALARLAPVALVAGLAGRSLVSGAAGLSLRTLVIVSLLGGGAGAVLLLATPVSVFTRLVPFLILFATVVFAWGSFFKKPRREDETGGAAPQVSPRMAVVFQFFIAVYGGYFGGGIGILMLAILTSVGLGVRHAGATKNVLSAVINVVAVIIFLARVHVPWTLVLYVAVSAIAGGQLGTYLLRRLDEKVLRVGITAIGVVLTVAMFVRA